MMKRSYNFGPDQAASIDALSAELGIDKTQVLMNGLRLFRTAVVESKRGNALGVIRDERILRELCGPWNDVGT